MNKLSTEERARIVSCLVEGNSIRSTVRMTGASKNTIAKLLRDIGIACAEYQDKAFHNLKCKRVQCDEIWSFCYAKQKNVPESHQGAFGFGDVWTWTALCADSKLMFSWLVGLRTVEYANEFMSDVAGRLADRVQLTTDGHRPYLQATEGAFNWKVDYAMLEKHYGVDSSRGTTRYSPSKLQSITVRHICGAPDVKHISTSFGERQNLNIRMGLRRFTRLTNAFSKKIDNHKHAIALYFMFYNYCRIHQTLRVTPAMEAGISDHVWELREVIELADQ